MKSLRLPFFALACCAASTSCSAGGIFNADPVYGPISVVNPTTGQALGSGTSAADPYAATVGGFSIGITEKNYTGPYTVSQTAFSTPNTQFNFSCFDPHTIDSSDKVNVVRFQIDGGVAIAPTPDPITGVTPAQVSPCEPGERETYLITDTKGHHVYFYLAIPQ